MATAACDRCMDWLARYTRKAGDSEEDAARKRISQPVVLVLVVGNIAMYLNSPQGFGTWRVCIIVLELVALICGILQFVSKISAAKILQVGLFFVTIAMLVLDLTTAAQLSLRAIGMFVLIMDACIVLRLPQSFHMYIMCMVILYIIVERAEAAYKYGMYDLVVGGTGANICDCSDPPCPLTLGRVMNEAAGYIFLLLTDYYLTRGFADGMHTQMRIVEASVQLAERVAGLLAAYSTAEARSVVEADGEGLPPALRESFARLLHNLDSYRVYLPESLLLPSESDEALRQRTAVPPPGVGDPEPHLCMCFTDIQSSTALWEDHPQGMYAALQLHNSLLRELACCTQGYEVKTIGDAFMLAFGEASSGCRFGLEAQRRLARQDWPPDLLQHPLCTTQVDDSGTRVWNGLRVRIGMHCGPVRVDANPISGRFDYFGPTVNAAARVENALRHGGLVGVTTAVLEALGAGGLQELGSPLVVSLGPREMKGIAEPVAVSVLLPPELAARAAVLSDGGSSPQPRLRRVQPATPEHNWDVRTASVSSHGSSHHPVRDQECSAGALVLDASPSAGVLHFAHSIADRPRHSSLGSGRTPAGRSALDLRLRQRIGTCATARAALHQMNSPEELQYLVAMMETSADSSQGLLETVLSASCVVSWNAHRPCFDHAASCMLFLRNAPSGAAHYGAASGELVFGNISTARRRFATVVTPAVELSTALAAEAELCSDHALCTDATAAHCAAHGLAFRAQLWLPRGQRPLEVWEVVSRRQMPREPWAAETATSDKWDAFLSDMGLCQLETSAGRSSRTADPTDTAVALAFTAAATAAEDAATVLAQLAQEHGDDLRARRLLERAERGTLRSRHIAPMRESPLSTDMEGGFALAQQCSESVLASSERSAA